MTEKGAEPKHLVGRKRKVLKPAARCSHRLWPGSHTCPPHGLPQAGGAPLGTPLPLGARSTGFWAPSCLGRLHPPMTNSHADDMHLSRDLHHPPQPAVGAARRMVWVPSTERWGVCDLHKAACHTPSPTGTADLPSTVKDPDLGSGVFQG